MKLGKLIIAGLCVFSLCSFSTVAPVQVDVTSCSTNSELNPDCTNKFYRPQGHADKDMYLAGFLFGRSGGLNDLNILNSDKMSNSDYASGCFDGNACLEYINEQRRSGRDDNNNEILE